MAKGGTVIVRRIGVLSAGKLSGLINCFFGIIAGGWFALVSLGVQKPPGDAPSDLFRSLVGIGAVFYLPVLNGVLGFVGGVLGAWLYNYVVPLVGGLEIELSEKDREPAGG